MRNPVYSALFMALTMITLAFLFFALEAPFIAGVQLAAYAGAVIVLFVMVLMIFNLKKEKNTFAKGLSLGLTKLFAMGFFLGFLGMVIYMSSDTFKTSPSVRSAKKERLSKRISSKLSYAKKNSPPFLLEEPNQILKEIETEEEEQDQMGTKNLAQVLFKEYLLAFELLGILLLLVAVGAVVISSRMKEEEEGEGEEKERQKSHA